MLRRSVISSIIGCCMLAGLGLRVFSQQGGQPARPVPLEDRRPPLFLRETFQMEKKDETILTQAHMTAPNVDLKIYGQTMAKWAGMDHAKIRATPLHGGLEIVWRPSPLDDPTFIFWGPCNTPCALAFRDRGNYVDLTDLAKIKWRTKQTGFHHMQLIIKTADGKWYIGDYAEGPSTDWLEREFSIIDMRWKEFDADHVVTKGTGAWAPAPDLSRVDEVGVTSLASGALSANGHGSSSAARLDWIEIYGRPVKR